PTTIASAVHGRCMVLAPSARGRSWVPAHASRTGDERAPPGVTARGRRAHCRATGGWWHGEVKLGRVRGLARRDAPGTGGGGMEDEVGYRGKLGLLVPSTNTVVEHDVNLVRVRGVTFHAARLYIERPSMASDAALEDFLQQIRDSLRVAVRDVMT